MEKLKIGNCYVLKRTNGQTKWRTIGRLIEIGHDRRWETLGRDDWAEFDEFKVIRGVRL